MQLGFRNNDVFTFPRINSTWWTTSLVSSGRYPPLAPQHIISTLETEDVALTMQAQNMRAKHI